MVIIDQTATGAALATSITAGMTAVAPGVGGTFVVADPTGYPPTGRFTVVINRGKADEEKILITSRSGATFTVAQRGYDDTVATSHTTGSTVELALPADIIVKLIQHVDDLEASPHATKLPVGTAAGHDVTARHAYGAAFGTPGAPTTIVPDTAASAGTGARPAREDHTHGITANTAVALTLTATSGEGVGAGWARSDHGHATSALPWGIVTRQSKTVDSAGFTTSGSTDQAISFTADATRLYKICWHSSWQLTGTGRWLITISDGSAFHRVADVSDDEGVSGVFDSVVYWEPTAGAKTVTVELTEISGTSTLTLIGAASFPRLLWAEDIGPR